MSADVGRVTLVVDPERVPDGRQIRRLTARIQDARIGRGLGAVLLDVWYTVVTVGLCLLFVVGIASTVHDTVPESARAGDALVAGGEVPAALVVVAAAGALLSLAGRLGPVGLGGGGAAWWLPMPVSRRGLLGPTVLRWPLISAGIGAVAAPTVVFAAFGVPASVGGVLTWAGLGAALFAALTAGAAGLQAALGLAGSRRVAVAGEVAMLVSTVAVAAAAVRAVTLPAWELRPGPWAWGTTAVLGATAVVTTWWARQQAEDLSGAVLRAQGSIGDRAQVAVLSLDLRELSRSLSTGSIRARRSSSWSMTAGGPRRAVVLADLALLVRNPRSMVQVAVACLLAVTAQHVVLVQSGLLLYLALVVTGFWAANAAAGGARHAEMVPVLDRLLPVSARESRVLRGGVPLLAATLWAVVALGALTVDSAAGGTATGGAVDVLWIGLAPAWALVLATAAVRGAYRSPARPRAAVTSPMGGVPPVGGLLSGLDVVLVGTLPTGLALFLGTLTPALVVVQYAVTLALVASLVAAVGRRPPDRRPASRPR